MRLAQDQLEHFRREGYLLSKGFLEAEEIAHLRDCYTETAARLQAEQVLENVQSGGDRDEDFQVYQIRTAHLRHPIFRMLINDSRLLDLVECLIGPDIRLIHYQGLYKPAATGGAIGWHQDNYYFNVAGERTVSVWMALDDATIENGCMWYLPGRHGARMAHEQLWDSSVKKGFYFAIPELEVASSGSGCYHPARGSFELMAPGYSKFVAWTITGLFASMQGTQPTGISQRQDQARHAANAIHRAETQSKTWQSGEAIGSRRIFPETCCQQIGGTHVGLQTFGPSRGHRRDDGFRDDFAGQRRNRYAGVQGRRHLALPVAMEE